MLVFVENDYLSPHRTIKNSYETWYFEHELVVKSINNSKEPIPAGLMEAPSTPSAAPSHSLSRVNEDNYIVINLDNHLCKFLREQGFESDASNIKEFQISEYPFFTILPKISADGYCLLISGEA